MEDNIADLKDLLNEIEEKKKIRSDKKDEIRKAIIEHRDKNETDEAKKIVADGNKILDDLDAEISKLESRSADMKLETEKKEKEEKRKMEDKIVEERNVDKHASLEYRTAFMNFIAKGQPSALLETRADAATTTTTAATVIPTTLMNEITRELKMSGNIYAKVRKLNVKGGVDFPILSVIPTATWINETTPSDRKALSTTKVSFSYYGLECKISQSLLSEYTSIDAFETQFASLAVEAIINAIEIAIFNGTGSGQPTGILYTSGIKTSSITAANLVKYDKLSKALSGLTAGYRVGAELVMATSTWDAIVGMVDNNGQPVARVNYGINGNGTTYSLFGYPVNLVEEDRIKSIDTATVDTDYIIVLGNFSKYAINSNGELSVIKYTDNDHNENVTKALTVVDGKVLDPKAFLAIKLVTA